MGEIFIVGATRRERRLDLHAVEDDGDGWRNVLPGYHEVRVHGDGVWHVAGFVLAADGAAALRLDGARLVDAHEDTAVARLRGPVGRNALVDVLARDVARARAWQQATSALERPLDRLAGADGLVALQADFVRAALHDDSAARARLPSLLHPWCAPAAVQAAPAVAAVVGRSVAAMVTLDPSLGPGLPAGDLVGTLSDAGNDRSDAELLAAANALQLALCRE
jgi:hypothetical protein